MSDTAGADRIVELTSGDQVDCAHLDELARGLGGSAIDPLLEALATSPSRPVRECLLTCLASLGDAARARAAARTGDARWYVIRNLVSLVVRGPLPDGFDLHPFLSGGDPRVRTEAVAGIRWLPDPQAAWVMALADPDPRVVTAALRAVDPITTNLVHPLASVARGAEVEEMRVLATAALSRSTDPAVVPVLLELSGASRSFFGRVRFRARSRVAAEALRGLVRFGDRTEVRPVLAAAERSSDPLLRGAVLDRGASA